MSKQDYSTELNVTAAFSIAVARAVAKRIATLAQTDAVAAANDFNQHMTAMSVTEQVLFADMVVEYAAELAAQ